MSTIAGKVSIDNAKKVITQLIPQLVSISLQLQATTQLHNEASIKFNKIDGILKKLDVELATKVAWVVVKVGWIYGLVSEDDLTGFKMHCHGSRLVCFIPKRPTVKSSAPTSLLNCLHQVLRWAVGYVEILFIKPCDTWYGYGCSLKSLERKFLVPQISRYTSILFMLMFLLIAVTSVLWMQLRGLAIEDPFVC